MSKLVDPATVEVVREAPARVTERFSERLRSGIAHRLDWDDLRPVQKISAQWILDGHNCVILAPTAGGKTESAFFPILDTIHLQKGPPVSCIYVSPLRALLNDQEERVATLASLVGLRSFKWHGDVGQPERRRFLDDPTDVLLTTPESLEVMLLSPHVQAPALFSDLQYLIIDEVHNFAEGDRGAHLLSVIERLRRFTEADIQRIGLSATVGNPREIAAWMQGSSERPCCVIDPAKPPIPRRVAVRVLADETEVGPLTANIAGGKKALFFVDSRRRVEETKIQLDQEGLPAFVHHGSVSRSGREEAEAQFTEAEECIIVCTSTMELGIDVGDLDVILHLDAPSRVNAYIQRLGRTGRRQGTISHMEFLCTDDQSLLLAVSLIRLGQRGWIEPVPCSRRATHVLLHQILAKVREHWGVSRSRLKSDLRNPVCFAEITEPEFDSMLEYLVATEVLHFADGIFSFGEEGERRWAPRNFLDLYSVFETPSLAVVVTEAGEEIGTLETWFVQAMEMQEFVFILGGRQWQVVEVDLDGDPGRVVVTRAPAGMPPKWLGAPGLMGRQVAEEHRAALLDDDDPPYLLGHAKERLELVRAEWRDILKRERVPVVPDGRDVVIHTFAGGRINNVLGRIIEATTDCQTCINNFSVTVKRERQAAVSVEEVRALLQRVASGALLAPDVRRQCVAGLPRYRLSKFQPYLPPALEADFLAERLLDFEGLAEMLVPARS